MATVYSLVCWGGRTGKQVTFTDAGDIVNSTNHGLRTGTRLRFRTDGSLPTGLSIVPAYYVGQGADASKFLLYTTLTDAVAGTNQVTFSGTGTGTHYANSVLMEEYFAQYAGRWGDAGSERCYDSIVSWNTGRAGASALDEEVCELGEAFTDLRTAASAFTLTVPAARTEITTKLAGARTEAFHGGVIGAGHIFYQTIGGYIPLTVAIANCTLDGFTVQVISTFYAVAGISCTKYAPVIANMIAIGPGGISSVGSNGRGISIANTSASGAKIFNCISAGWLNGIYLINYLYGAIVANNIATMNGVGFNAAAATNMLGSYYNNISVGNTTNWSTITSGMDNAAQNAGLSGEAWVTGTNSRVTIATTDFVYHTNGDYRPASSSSHQVDSGVKYYGALDYDIADAERPNYNNGGAEAFDVGCYEFDHGFGNHPATATISLTNIVSGSRVLITRNDTSAVLYNDVPGTSLSLSTGYIGAFTVIVRKASASPYYREFTAGGTTVADQTTTIQALQQLDE